MAITRQYALALAYQQQAYLLWERARQLYISHPEVAAELKKLAFEAAKDAESLCEKVVNNQGGPKHKWFGGPLSRKITELAKIAETRALV